MADCLAVDCGRAEQAAPPAPRSYEGIDGSAHDYDSLLRLLLDHMSRLAPDWAERSSADLTQVLLELAAYAGDQLSYLQDRVALEGFLRTATQRESVRRHLRLIDATLDPGFCAQSHVVFGCTGAFPLFLPAGFAITTAAQGDEAAVVYETAHDAVLHPALSSVALSVDAPSSADSLQAVLAADLSASLTAGQWLLFEQSTDADATREWAQVDSVVFAATTTTVTLKSPLAAGYTAGSARVQGNRVRATHGRSQTQTQTGTGAANQSLALEESPLIWLWDAAAQQSVSTLRVSVDGAAWTEVEDFLDATAASQVYTVSTDNRGQVSVYFGDGTRGATPAKDSRIEASYRVGDDSVAAHLAGQVGPNALTAFEDRAFADISQSVTDVRNPFASQAPRPPQTLGQAKLLGPATLREQTRAVVPADYEALLMQGVQVGASGALVKPLAVRARITHTGSWHTVVASVDLPGRTPLATTPGLRAAFEAQLAAYKMAGLDVRVEDARYCPLHLSLRIEVGAQQFARDVRDAVTHALLTAPKALLAAGQLGFGAALYVSDLYAVVSRVPGVLSVAVTRFKRLGDRYPDSEALGYIEVGELEIARCDNDPEHPENGVLTVRSCGGREG